MKNLFNNKNSKFRLVAWGGLYTAIAVLLAILGTSLSFLDVIYLAATPIILAAIQGGLIFGLQVSFASALIVSIILGPFPAGLYFVVSAVPAGLAIGEMLRRKAQISSTIMFSTITLSLCLIATSYMAYITMGRTLEQDIAETAKTFNAFMSSAGHNVSENETSKIIYMLIPCTIIITSLIYSVYLYFFNVWVLKRLKISEQDFGADIREIFNYPKYFAYIFATALFSIVCGKAAANDSLILVGMNLFYIFGFLFLFKGLFLIRIVMFVFVKNILIRLFIGLIAMTFAAPATALIGLYFCACQKDIEIRYTQKK